MFSDWTAQPVGLWRSQQTGETFANVYAEEITPRLWKIADVSLRAFRAEAILGERFATGYGIAEDPLTAIDRATDESLERLAAQLNIPARTWPQWHKSSSNAEYPDISLGVASGANLQDAQLKAKMELIEKTALHLAFNLFCQPLSWDVLPPEESFVLFRLVQSLREFGYEFESRVLGEKGVRFIY